MFSIDFKDGQTDSLLHGFIKGLSAPAVLFNLEEAPPVPAVEQVLPPKSSPAKSLRGDWAAIGNDFRKVIDAHGSTTATEAARCAGS